jgi:hypothetical protein
MVDRYFFVVYLGDMCLMDLKGRMSRMWRIGPGNRCALGIEGRLGEGGRRGEAGEVDDCHSNDI